MRQLLLLNCVLIDFAAFVVIFAVTRSLAEKHAPQSYLGVVGAGLSFHAGIGSIAGGLLSHRFDGRRVFLVGAVLLLLSTIGSSLQGVDSYWFLPTYWLLGVGLGFVYPPLIGWLNQGEKSEPNRRSVSRTLILFCIAWNLGMMSGQLAAGTLFASGPCWTFGVAISASLANLLVSFCAVACLPNAVELRSEVPLSTSEEIGIATRFKRLGWIANLGGMFGGSMVINLLPDLAVTIGVVPEHHGFLLASWRAVIIATYLLLHNATFWHYRFGASLVSQIVAAVGLLVISQAESSTMLLIGLALLGQLVGFNYFSGLYYSTVGSSQEKRALAAGIHEATLATGMAIGTIAGGALGSYVNFRAPYVLAAVVLVVLLVGQVIARRRWC